MSVPASLAGLVGRWTGTMRLWMSPEEPAIESDSSALVSLAAQGRFLSFEYAWAEGGEPQAGLLLVGHEPRSGAVTAVWIDSWHTQDKFMVCEGSVGPDGALALRGSYAAPPGPDWGWQIRLAPTPCGTFDLVMHNVTPEGQEAACGGGGVFTLIPQLAQNGDQVLLHGVESTQLAQGRVVSNKLGEPMYCCINVESSAPPLRQPGSRPKEIVQVVLGIGQSLGIRRKIETHGSVRVRGGFPNGPLCFAKKKPSLLHSNRDDATRRGRCWPSGLADRTLDLLNSGFARFALRVTVYEQEIAGVMDAANPESLCQGPRWLAQRSEVGPLGSQSCLR